MKYF
jgi:activating signal cointegrator complex subunit 3